LPLLLLQAANAVGYGGKSHQAILDATRTPKGSVDYFVELHIEQGPLLEKVGEIVAVVVECMFHNSSCSGGICGDSSSSSSISTSLAAAKLALWHHIHTSSALA
jgi:hypothetical protein